MTLPKGTLKTVLKRLFVVVAIAFGIGAAGFGVLMFYAVRAAQRIARQPKAPMPVEIRAPRILIGEGFLARTTLVSDPGLGSISDVKWEQLDPTPGVSLGVAGCCKADFCDAQGRTLKSVRYEKTYPASSVTFVSSENGRACNFFVHGSWVRKCELLDHTGKTLWSYGGWGGIDDSKVENTPGNGPHEFLIGFNGGGGIHLVNAGGEQVWKAPGGNVWGVEFLDVDGRNDLLVAHSEASGKLFVRSMTGKELRQIQLPMYLTKFSKARWPTRVDREYFLVTGVAVGLYDEYGKLVKSYAVPGAEKFEAVAALPVLLSTTAPPYFAVLMKSEEFGRSMVYVFDAGSSLVFQELLGDSCDAMSVRRGDPSGRESLLIGGNGRVYEIGIPALSVRGR